MNVKMAIGLYFAILAGTLCTVEAQAVQCAQLATDCALNMTNVLLDNVQKNLFAVEYTCKAVDDYNKCMKGDGTVTCPDTEKLFQDQLKTMNIDIQTLCGNAGGNTGENAGGNTGGTTGLSSLLGISILLIQATCMISRLALCYGTKG